MSLKDLYEIPIIILILIIILIVGIVFQYDFPLQHQIFGSQELKEDIIPSEIEECQIKVSFSRIVDFKNDRQLKYRSRPRSFKPTIHWGQRKLLLSEIEFLTLHGGLSNTVVYAGASPGTHLKYLSELFPNHKFILYDPNQFDKKIQDIPSIELHTGENGYFDDREAKLYVRKKVLFISDIRTVPENASKSNEDFEKHVKENMDQQMRWHLIMKPAYSMLKFRLPYSPGKTKYLEGDIYYQVWGPSSTTEGRLMTNTDKTIIYDNTKYESIMYRFNTCTRVQKFPISKEISSHFKMKSLKSYDFAAEIDIIKQYLLKMGKIQPGDKNINAKITEMIKGINESLEKSFDDQYNLKLIKYSQLLAEKL